MCIYMRLFSNSFYSQLFGTHLFLLGQIQIFIGWCVDLRDRRQKKKKKKVMIQVKQLSFANIKIGQKGSKKQSWITILTWHDMRKTTAYSLRFQSIWKMVQIVFWMTSRFVLKPIDFSLSIWMMCGFTRYRKK